MQGELIIIQSVHFYPRTNIRYMDQVTVSSPEWMKYRGRATGVLGAKVLYPTNPKSVKYTNEKLSSETLVPLMNDRCYIHKMFCTNHKDYFANDYKISL
jgi:hypothetical protein